MGTPNYNVNPHEVPHYYDLGSGELIVGTKAYERALLTGADLENVRGLGSLLLDRTVEINPTQYEPLDVNGWSLHRYRKFGQWLHLATTAEDEPYSNLSTTIFERSYYLGLGPHTKRIIASSRFGSLDNFYQEAAIPAKYRRGLFSDWPRDRFADLVVDAFINKEPGQTVSEALAERAMTDPDHPSIPIIIRTAGTLSSLLAERGFPDIRRFTEDDFTDWGVALMVANNGLTPTRYHLDYLSKKHRGPAAKTICNNFDFLSLYQRRIKEEYDLVVGPMNQRLQERIGTLRQQRKGSTLAVPLMRAAHTPVWQGLRIGAQLMLLDAVKPYGLSADKLEIVATVIRQREFVEAMSRLRPGVNITQFRALAQKLGIEGDIWPVHNPEFLRLPPNQIGIRKKEPRVVSLAV